MKKTLKIVLLTMLIALTYFSCQKELSFDNLGVPVVSTGLLQANVNGECLPITVLGGYVTSQQLTSSNQIQAMVNVTVVGPYKIFTDTLNGYSFSASGNFNSTGVQSVTLAGTGIPISTGNDIFRLKYNDSDCSVSINVLPATVPQAEYTLQNVSGNCSGIVVNGNYTENSKLSGTNSAVVNVNVTKVGPYSISTSVSNGITFSASGNFSSTGLQQVILQGSGTPLVAGLTTISITGVGNKCGFEITVNAASLFDYYPRTAASNWTYEIDDNPLDTARFFVANPLLTIEGNIYNLFNVSRDNVSDSSGYYRKSGSDYYHYMNLGDFIGFDKPLWGEYVFLKDNGTVGTNWKSASFTGEVTIAGLSTQTMIVRFSNTILEKDVSMPVTTSLGTTNYTNVIVVEEKYEQFIRGNWVDITMQVGSFRKYFARDVGMIKYEVINGTGTVTAFFELRRFQVF